MWRNMPERGRWSVSSMVKLASRLVVRGTRGDDDGRVGKEKRCGGGGLVADTTTAAADDDGLLRGS